MDRWRWWQTADTPGRANSRATPADESATARHVRRTVAETQTTINTTGRCACATTSLLLFFLTLVVEK